MQQNEIYCILAVLRVVANTLITAPTEQTIHGAFLHLIRQYDSSLSVRLHNAPGPRPYTLSLLSTIHVEDGKALIRHDQDYHIRVTLFDDGTIWDGLHRRFLKRKVLRVRAIHQEACKSAHTLGEQEPSEWPVRMLCVRILEQEQFLAEGNEKKFKRTYRITYTMLHADERNPQMAFEIDHTQIYVLTRDTRSEKYRTKSGKFVPGSSLPSNVVRRSSWRPSFPMITLTSTLVPQQSAEPFVAT